MAELLGCQVEISSPINSWESERAKKNRMLQEEREKGQELCALQKRQQQRVKQCPMPTNPAVDRIIK